METTGKTALVIGLGCPKNDVDTDILSGILTKAGYTAVRQAESADIAIVNTCGFIEEAKTESIDTILDLVSLKNEGRVGKIFVYGCLAQRYRKEIAKDIPEIDNIFGVEEFDRFARKIGSSGDEKIAPWEYRNLVNTGHYAYLKIAEGCDNRCYYCAVPLIRGGYRSRSIPSLAAEAEILYKKGVKELILVAQDSTLYGKDLKDGSNLHSLVKEINERTAFEWIRVMYAYPAHVTEDFFKLFAFKNVCKYIDLPVQHISDSVLRAMGRRGNSDTIFSLLERLRSEVSGMAVRTSLIVGYPAETEEDFNRLVDFVREVEFDRLGVFPYSSEEGTKAHLLGDPVPPEVKNERAEILIDCQREIAYNKNRNMIGRSLKVLVDEYHPESGMAVARTEHDAPEIDNVVYIKEEDRTGEFTEVTITDAGSYELFA